MLTFTSDYFHNPSYLRIHGRPVVFLYLTRTLTGDVAGMIKGARTVLEAKGFNPFFIGDGVYRAHAGELPDPAGPILTTTPQVARIEQFDAVTSYILYYGDPNFFLGPTQDFTGYPGSTDIVADERHLLSEYSAATDGRAPVIPDIRRRFNDRGFRLPTNHPCPAAPEAAWRRPGVDARPPLPAASPSRRSILRSRSSWRRRGTIGTRTRASSRSAAACRDPNPHR